MDWLEVWTKWTGFEVRTEWTAWACRLNRLPGSVDLNDWLILWTEWTAWARGLNRLTWSGQNGLAGSVD